MRGKSRVAVAVAAAIMMCGSGTALASTQAPIGPVSADTVAAAQAEATRTATASTNAARDAALSSEALDGAKTAATAAADAATAAAATAAASGLPADQAAADAASAAAANAAAAQAAAQLDYNAKAAAAASAAADATAAAASAQREAASFARLSRGTSVEGTATIPDSDPFPDNATHSDNVEVVSHVRGIVGANASCPAFNPTKCPGFSSLNFVHYEQLGYDMMVANGTGGLSIWSLKDPAHPVNISQITVDQLKQPGETMTQFWEGENMTVDSRRKLVFMSRDSGAKGLFIIDVKDPWHPVLLGFHPVPQGHTATCLDDCRFIWSVGTGVSGKSSPVSVTDIRDPDHPFTYGAQVAANIRRSGSTSGSTHSVDVDFDGVAWVSGTGGVRGYYTQGLHEDPATGTDRYATPYDPIPYAGGPVTGSESVFLHNSYHFPGPLLGEPAGDVMLITNENNNRNCATAGYFIIASLAGTYDADGATASSKMARLSTYTAGGKPGQFVDPTGAIGDCSAHWFTVKGNVVALGNYEQGVRFIDISDPRNPQQVGWYRVPVRSAGSDGPAIISSNTAGAYWHDRYLYVADYARGIDVLKYTGAITGTIQPKVCWNACGDAQTAGVWDEQTQSVGGNVAATLSLALGDAASFGDFTPGTAKDYTATTTADVLSTAGDAALTVADPSATAPGHLVNGTFSLPAPLQAKATNAGTTGGSFVAVGGTPAPLLSYLAPASNDAVTLSFQQHVGATDALRTGAYGKALTFTLSTTTP